MRRSSGSGEFGRRMVRVGIASAIFLGSASLAGCHGSEDDRSAHDKAAACLSSGLEDRSLTHDIAVPRENFKIRATYSTDYDVASWKITDTKALDIELAVVPDDPKTKLPTILIDNLHADATVKSTKQAVNGLPADSFDDHMHTGTQDGFEISPQYPYTERFIIGGFSQTLTSGWGFMVGGYGSLDIDDKRLTEDNLIKQGAYGEEISMVTDLLMRPAGDPYFHKTVIGDDLIVPLEGKSC